MFSVLTDLNMYGVHLGYSFQSFDLNAHNYEAFVWIVIDLFYNTHSWSKQCNFLCMYPQKNSLLRMDRLWVFFLFLIRFLQDGYSVVLLKAENCAVHGNIAWSIGNNSSAFLTENCDMLVRMCGRTIGYNNFMVILDLNWSKWTYRMNKNALKLSATHRWKWPYCAMEINSIEAHSISAKC